MEHSGRYLVGIDLGTTNSVVAYADTEMPARGGSVAISLLQVPQLVGFGELRALPSLPSFLYFPTEDELQSATLRLPWEESPQSIAGVIARDHGALVPTRQVMSAKSWLAHGGVDREANILPREAQPPLISPVDASARYLQHLRSAWNHAFSVAEGNDAASFEKQEIVLTVPASFDEEARELTVEAARRAGLDNFILLEEPLAAFYAWTAFHQERLREELNDGELVLICDIGGGTSDFSLIRAHVSDGDVQFERKAIGEHLLLGGDNLDVALARTVESRLNNTRLSMRQRHALQRACCAAKERLLGDPASQTVPITVLGSGRAVVGQMLTTEMRRDDVLQLLTTGFLPMTSADEMPKRTRSAGLRELGLPYASDPAITRHLAAFLKQAGTAMGESRMARPDAVLFNGGFCEPPMVRDRIVDAIASWFPQLARPRVLDARDMGSAVAVGAARYAQVRRGGGARVRAGSARTYYIGLRSAEGLRGVCVLPSGTEEGTRLPAADREFAALANRPVSFALLSSRTRHEALGEVADLQEGDVHRHAPLVTVLRYGKKMREQELAVRLQATFTELGTLELWCESMASPHRWRLQFELRGDQKSIAEDVPRRRPPASSSGTSAHDETLRTAVDVVRLVFSKSAAAGVTPDTIVAHLETALGKKRDSWPAPVVRGLADALIEMAEGRKQSPQHEMRWLNLVGFCLRPGFGATGDETRVAELRKLSVGGPAFQELQSEVQWLVLLRRIAGGLHASAQHELHRKLVASLDLGSKKGKRARTNPQIAYESWRLAVSLEHLPAERRVPLGDELASRIGDDTRWLWPLARIGARIPLYGPLMCVVPPEKAMEWLTSVLGLPSMAPETVHAVVELARNTGDRSRDLDADIRNRALRRLKEAGADQERIERLQKFVTPDGRDAVRMFGESLPPGLQLISSANCLLSITALNPEPGRVA